MALPLRLLWNLRVNRKQKAALVTIFSLGCIIIVFAIVRVVEIQASTHHVDPVWLALWSMIEASVGEWYFMIDVKPQSRLTKIRPLAIIVSCLPLFRVLFYSNRADSAFNRRRSSTRFSRGSRTRLFLGNLGPALRMGPAPENASGARSSAQDSQKAEEGHVAQGDLGMSDRLNGYL